MALGREEARTGARGRRGLQLGEMIALRGGDRLSDHDAYVVEAG